MIIDVAPLLEPVSDTAPGGADIRETEDYEAIAAEIEKMTSPTSSGAVDWQKIETLGSRLLSTQGKDFMVAAWVAAAWTERYGIEGLGAGLLLQEGLVSRYWETAQPPLKRLRGRRNALSWWTERTAGWLENRDVPPLREETRQAMVTAVESLDARLAELDPESPPLGAFIQQIRRLEAIVDVSPETPSAAVQTPPAAESPAAASAAPRAEAAATAAVPAATPNPPAAPTAATATPRPFGAAAPAADTLDSLDAIIEALAPALSYLGQITNALRALDHFHPLAIEMSRFAARSALLSLPPAQQGATSLTAPPVAITDAFATITRSGNADGLIEFCESRITTFPYWLDLDRESARGYGLLGEAGVPMRQAVIQNALAFVKRLPGIEQLTFADGTPFADEATRQWLEQCQAEHQGGGVAQDRYGRVRQQAMAAFEAGRPDEAMQCYQGLIESTWSGRERFQARLALAELCLGQAGDANPIPLVASLATECRERQLAAWEPGLALQAWQTILRAARQALTLPALAEDEHLRRTCQQFAQDALRELAAIDLAAAAKHC